MLALPSRPGPDISSRRHWKPVSAYEAVAAIKPGSTLAVGWLGDHLGLALAETFVTSGQPGDLTIIYAATRGNGRNHGLNLLAQDGLVRRVVGGQWHPVPALQALTTANRIEGYSLPAGVIRRLFRDIAEGLPGHLSRSGLGTFADPRNGGGRLNLRTLEQLVRLVRPAGDEALLYDGFPIDAALIGVGFMEGTAALAMTRESLMIARAAHRSGGTVFAQVDRVGTLKKLPPGHVVAADTLVDILVEADPRDRPLETFSPASVRPGRQRLLAH